ncbi:MAG: hypothetical protein WAN35_19275 [Terracidiphilus sp.]
MLTDWQSKGNLYEMTFLQPYFVLLASCSLIGALFILMAQLMKQRRRGWHDIVAELQRLNTEELSAVAIDFLTPHQGQIDLEPGAIWESLGGYRGLRKMRENAEVMLALAACAQQWNFTEAVIVTERMRMDAAQLRRAVRRVEVGLIPSRMLQRFQLTLPLHAQEASSAYYLMRQRLLCLYQTSHAGLYPKLAEAL